jgi:hypothetical protein
MHLFSLSSVADLTTPSHPAHSDFARKVVYGNGLLYRTLVAALAWTTLGLSWGTDYSAEWWIQASHLSFLLYAMSMSARAVLSFFALRYVSAEGKLPDAFSQPTWGASVALASAEASILYGLIICIGYWSAMSDWNGDTIPAFICVMIHAVYLATEAIDWFYFALPVRFAYSALAFVLLLAYEFMFIGVYFVYGIGGIYSGLTLLPGLDPNTNDYTTQVGAAIGWALLFSLFVFVAESVLWAYVFLRNAFYGWASKEATYQPRHSLAGTLYASA